MSTAALAVLQADVYALARLGALSVLDGAGMDRDGLALSTAGAGGHHILAEQPHFRITRAGADVHLRIQDRLLHVWRAADLEAHTTEFGIPISWRGRHDDA